MKSITHYVYFLQSLKDASYYIGVSNNVNRRVLEHNNRESKSTAFKRPWEVKKIEEYSDIKAAYKRERFLKKLKSRKVINKIINSDKN